MHEIDPTTVGLAITLCTEEICPAFLGKEEPLLWAIPDPASDDPNLAPNQLQVRFRTGRYEIRRRLISFGKERGSVP